MFIRVRYLLNRAGLIAILSAAIILSASGTAYYYQQRLQDANNQISHLQNQVDRLRSDVDKLKRSSTSVTANPCAPPSTSSNTYGANFQGTEYWAQNVTFTDVNQQITLAGVQFATVSFPDSSVSHLENGQCVSVNSPTTQASIQVKITFTGGYSETLSFSYKGGLQSEQSSLTTQLHPRAGLLWQPGESYLILLVSKT